MGTWIIALWIVVACSRDAIIVTGSTSTSSTIASIAVSPSSVIGGLGTLLRFSAVVKNGEGDTLTGQPVTWASSDSTVVAVSSGGTAVSVGLGAAVITATAAGRSGSASASIVLYPNQRAGVTPFVDMDFSGLPAANGNPGMILGDFGTLQAGGVTHITVQSDATAPQSPPNVLQVDFEMGTPAGGETGTGYRVFDGWALGATESTGTEYREIYESLWFKVPTVAFETHPLGLKLLAYWGVGDMHTDGLALQMFSATGSGYTGSDMNDVRMVDHWGAIDMYTQGPFNSATRYSANITPGMTISFQTWHHFEMHCVLNDIGVANGVWEWWLDGTLIGQYTDVIFRDATYPHGFWGRHFDPVWGSGGGTAVKTRTDILWLDHLYLSGVPLP